MVRARALLRFLFAASAIALGSAADACVTYKDGDEAAFLDGDLIFVGDLTDYEIVVAQDGFVDEELAVLTYRVDAVLKGEAGKTIRLWWPNSTFGLPPSLSRYDSTLVAVDKGPSVEGDWTGWLHYPSRNAITRLPRVHQPSCSGASILPFASSDVTTIKRWIVAGKADRGELSYDGFKIIDGLPARRTGQIDLLPIGGGVFAGVLLLLAIRRWRRRKAAG